MAAEPVKVTPAMLEAALREVDWARQDALGGAAIDAQIAADPELAPDTSDRSAAAVLVQRIRRGSGLSQAAFATRYRLSLRSLQEWEQGRRAPDAAALLYLRVIEREPEAVCRALVGAAA